MTDRWLLFLAGSVLGGLTAWGLAALRQGRTTADELMALSDDGFGAWVARSGVKTVSDYEAERRTRPVEPNVVPHEHGWRTDFDVRYCVECGLVQRSPTWSLN